MPSPVPSPFVRGGSISANGRFVVFAAGTDNAQPSVFVWDRTDELAPPVRIGTMAYSSEPAISGDGRVVVYVAKAGPDGREQLAIYEAGKAGLEWASVGSNGVLADGDNDFPAVSRDGNFVGFRSVARNLAPGRLDFYDIYGAYLRDRRSGTTTPITGQWGGNVQGISDDGRIVAFRPVFAGTPLSISDLATGMLAPLPETKGQWWDLVRSVLSGDGRMVAFQSDSDDLDGDDPNGAMDVFVRAINPLGASTLNVLDTRTNALVGPAIPATQVAVSKGIAALLGTDQRVRVWTKDQHTQDLGVVATAVALSPPFVAALVPSEDPAGTAVQVRDVPGTCPWMTPTRNGKPQAAEELAAVGSVVAFLTPESAQVGVDGDCSPNGGRLGTDLNDDGDCDDRVLQFFTLPKTAVCNAALNVINVGQAAEDFVIGGEAGSEFIAFRTRECAQGGPVTKGCPEGGQTLNGDDDAADDVLQVYDVTGRCPRINTGSAVSPCRFEGCDPRIPYRVGAHTVTFLTLEADEGADLNQDGDAANPDDLVLQLFNVRRAFCGGELPGASRTLLSAVGAPRCATTSQTGEVAICTGPARDATSVPCAGDDDCRSGCWCRAQMSGCIRATSQSCCVPKAPEPCSSDPCPVPTPDAACGPSSACGAGEFCEGAPGSMGSCMQLEGPCVTDLDCGQGATCHDRNVERLVSPLAPLSPSVSSAAGQALANTGRCVDTSCTAAGTCPDSGPCDPQGRCPPGSKCQPDLVAATANDADGDEIPDLLDNCPNISNPDQGNTGPVGVGDACRSRLMCGDGVVTRPFEICDDGRPSDSCFACIKLCGSTPRNDCEPGDAGSSTLQIDARRGRLEWRRKKDPVTSARDFGNPRSDENYALCIYDQSGPQPIFDEVATPSGGACTVGACWTIEGGGRFDYTSGLGNGISRMRLSAGHDRKAKISVTGIGKAVIPTVMPLEPTVTVQLVNNMTGACWQNTFSSAGIVKSTKDVFRARSD